MKNSKKTTINLTNYLKDLIRLDGTSYSMNQLIAKHKVGRHWFSMLTRLGYIENVGSAEGSIYVLTDKFTNTALKKGYLNNIIQDIRICYSKSYYSRNKKKATKPKDKQKTDLLKIIENNDRPRPKPKPILENVSKKAKQKTEIKIFGITIYSKTIS